MKLSFKSLVVSTGLAMVSLALPFSTYADNNTKPVAVESIDINKYAGKWYEIAHLPMFFQRNCVANTTANYSINADKTVGVLNSCTNKKGEMISSEGVAYPQNEGNSKLKVSFLPSGLRWIPFTKGDYWVLRVDPDYQVALVGGPSTEYLWILSRSPQIDQATYNSYLQTAKHYGYDVSKLIKTTQTNY
ncbi:lipocalin family protein [Acinetobacter nosocomialis]|uniref:lipocalin family protein n=1 Tax=Acinetobacter nosocomialis TaxID=106654 RepID=UPI0023B05495|nr:lipocalin family protein [Acinetobacter nosocomialis]MDE9407787.1 lipocalin family protein [Acinetobacter nosocomialis]